MHIEPGIVNGAKLGLSYITAAAAAGITIKFLFQTVFRNFLLLNGILKCILTTLCVFAFFEILPHYPLGVSEVHFIFGATLFLLFGVVATAFGLALGLFLQGILFAPSDIPMFYVNISTLLFPLFAVYFVAKKTISSNLAYKDLKYRQLLALTGTYQGGIIAWVAFWSFYGQGFSAEASNSVVIFSLGYSTVIAIECILDVGILAMVKRYHNNLPKNLFIARLASTTT
tara:strand:- start:571 stop:1254 length:684 start_codon:yes stop_codon:yes gene_type:complete